MHSNFRCGFRFFCGIGDLFCIFICHRFVFCLLWLWFRNTKQIRKCDGLGHAGIAQAVDTGQIVRYKIVFCIDALIGAGNRADILLIPCDRDQTVAARNRTGGLAGFISHTRAYNAADVASALQGAFGIAGVDCAGCVAGNAAYIIAILTLGISVVFVANDVAQIHLSANATDIASLGYNFTIVDAILNNSL